MRIALYTPIIPGSTERAGLARTRRLSRMACANWGMRFTYSAPAIDPLPTMDGSEFTSLGPITSLRRTRFFPVPGVLASWTGDAAAGAGLQPRRRRVSEMEGYGLNSLKTARVPIVVRLSTSSREAQEIDGATPNRWRVWDVKRERWLDWAAKVLVTHSDAHRRTMAEEAGISADRILVHPFGVEASRPGSTAPPSWPADGRLPRPTGASQGHDRVVASDSESSPNAFLTLASC